MNMKIDPCACSVFICIFNEIRAVKILFSCSKVLVLIHSPIRDSPCHVMHPNDSSLSVRFSFSVDAELGIIIGNLPCLPF